MQTITTREVKRRMESERPLVINVLDRDQFVKAHIPDTVNVSVSDDDFVSRVERLASDKDDAVIVYCAGPDCEASPTAAAELEEAGFSRVLDYEGGMKEWRAAGHPIEREKETAEVTAS